MKLITKELIFPLEGRVTPSCHASTLVRLPGGDLLAAWFGGSREGADDVEIYCARRTEDGWSSPAQVSISSSLPCWNPVLYRQGNAITLWYKRGKSIPAWQSYARVSTDGGASWGPEMELVPGDKSGGRGPVKNKPILSSNGWLIAGASREYADDTWLAFADLSPDGGKTWRQSAYLQSEPPARLIQPTLWEDAGGTHMLLRSASGWVYRADSADHGLTWSTARPASVPNNNSGIDCAALPDGRLCLACNPVGVKGIRTPISLLVSKDHGASWEKEMDLETSEGEYSYPAVIYAEGELHITFTYRRQSIMYCKIRVSET